MGGGVNPLEWILPPVAIAHTAVDLASKTVGAPIPGTPGSPDALTQDAEDEQQRLLDLERQSASQRLAGQPRAQTAQEEMESRRRAISASQALGGGRKRASQYLTEQGTTLAGVA